MDQQQQNLSGGPPGQPHSQQQPQHQQYQEQPRPQALQNQDAGAGRAPHQAMNSGTGAFSGMDPQIMGQLMTNPTLAAAAAASPLFPPSAFQTNPGAFLTLSEYYSSPTAKQNEQNAKGSTAMIASTVGINNAPQQVTAGQETTRGGSGVAVPPTTQTSAANVQQQQNQPNVFGFPANLQQTLMPYGAGMMQNGAMQLVGGAPNSVQAAHQLAANNANIRSMMNNSSFSGATGGSSVSSSTDRAGLAGNKKGKKKKEMTAEERAQQNRDRNREHARSTRLRKKAYIQKLKELVEGLHAERTEEVRQRRVAIQHLAEMQNVRRAVIQTFLKFHAGYEKDDRKWSTILEDDFWLKQPVTPYRCFRRSEIEQVGEILY